MKGLRWILVALLAVVLSGCIDVETVVRIKADGSGEVEERVLMGEQLSGFAAGMGEQAGDSGGMVDEAELRTQAKEMGPGVSLVSAEEVSDGQRKGYKAVFAFDDINNLRINQNPGDKTPSQGMQEEEPKEEFVTFRFTPGDPAELRIITPEPEMGKGDGKSGSGASGGGQNDPAAMAMMQQMFKDMRIAMTVEVVGDIIETNAAYQQGSRITLMELDFGKLMQDADKFQKLAESNPETIAEVQELMEGVEGIKVQLEPELHVVFAAGGASGAQAKADVARQVGVAVPDFVPAAADRSYAWHDVEVGSAGDYIFTLVEVSTVDGAVKGMLVAANAGGLTVKSSPENGGDQHHIATSQVLGFRVFHNR